MRSYKALCISRFLTWAAADVVVYVAREPWSRYELGERIIWMGATLQDLKALPDTYWAAWLLELLEQEP